MKSPSAQSQVAPAKFQNFFILLLLLVAAAGCRSSRPADADGYSDPGRMGAATDEDLILGTPLPERGSFNPQGDVSYREFTGPNMTTNVNRTSDEHTGTDAGKIYFATNSNAIMPSQRPKLEKISSWMQQNPSRSILIAGHCDERGTLEYNRALGERRAIAVRDYLIGLGITGERLHTYSFGEEKPAVPGTGPDVWAQNRRAEVGVINE